MGKIKITKRLKTPEGYEYLLLSGVTDKTRVSTLEKRYKGAYKQSSASGRRVHYIIRKARRK